MKAREEKHLRNEEECVDKKNKNVFRSEMQFSSVLLAIEFILIENFQCSTVTKYQIQCSLAAKLTPRHVCVGIVVSKCAKLKQTAIIYTFAGLFC
jgi:hypothetical protein